MADTDEAETETTPRRNGNGAHHAAAPRRRTKAREDDLETQIAQLQSDLGAITNTLTRMGENTVGELRANATKRAQELRGRGEDMLESAQGELGMLEKQVRDTIREKPLMAVAGAVAMGFLIALVTR
jgi:ElaB/YqjD/DUF883 family membrane-anchored ribosome-binding protein